MTKKGFTLIELIVAIGILGVLAMAVLMVLDPFSQLQKSNDVKRKSDLAQIQRVLESYYQDNGNYPVACSNNTFQIQAKDGTCVAWGTSWQPYINLLPKDPTLGVKYAYVSANSNQGYYLYASLDRANDDPKACTGGSWCTSITSDEKSQVPPPCGANRVCNYGVSSPDLSP